MNRMEVSEAILKIVDGQPNKNLCTLAITLDETGNSCVIVGYAPDELIIQAALALFKQVVTAIKQDQRINPALNPTEAHIPDSPFQEV